MGQSKKMDVKLPDKLTYKRREVVQLTKLDGKVLDFWESEFGGFAPVVNNTGEKFYSRRDVELILKIKRLLFVEKVGKADIKEVIGADVPSPPQSAARTQKEPLGQKNRDLIKSRLKEILTILDKNDKSKH